MSHSMTYTGPKPPPRRWVKQMAERALFETTANQPSSAGQHVPKRQTNASCPAPPPPIHSHQSTSLRLHAETAVPSHPPSTSATRVSRVFPQQHVGCAPSPPLKHGRLPVPPKQATAFFACHAVPESRLQSPIAETPSRPPEPPEPKAFLPSFEEPEPQAKAQSESSDTEIHAKRLQAEVGRIIHVKRKNVANDWVLILGLHRGFTQSDLKQRWSELIKLLHPDKIPAEVLDKAGGADACRRAHDELRMAHQHAKTFLEQEHTGSVPPWAMPPSYPWLRQGRRPKPAPPREPWPGPDPAMPQRLAPGAVTVIEIDISRYLRSRSQS